MSSNMSLSLGEAERDARRDAHGAFLRRELGDLSKMTLRRFQVATPAWVDPAPRALTAKVSKAPFSKTPCLSSSSQRLSETVRGL